MDAHTDPGCNRTMDPDMAFGRNPGLRIIVAPGGSRWHSRPHVSVWRSCSMALEYQHGLRQWARSQRSPQPSVITEVKEIHTLTAVGPWTQISYSSVPDVTLTLGDSRDHSDQYGFCSVMILYHLRSHRWNPCSLWWQHGSQISTQTLAALGPHT